MAPPYQITHDELRERLRETLTHMQRSAAAYDAGDTSEARRLANSIRLLVKHRRAGQTKALLQQLGLLDRIPFLDTCGPISLSNLAPEHPVLQIELNTATGARFKARLGQEGPWGPPRKIPFAEWWAMLIVRNQAAGVEFARKDLVLNVAERDGGTHVDPTLDEKYAAQTRLNAHGWVATHNGKLGAVRPIELAHIRQIAYEVIVTLTQLPPAVVSP